MQERQSDGGGQRRETVCNNCRWTRERRAAVMKSVGGLQLLAAMTACIQCTKGGASHALGNTKQEVVGSLFILLQHTCHLSLTIGKKPAGGLFCSRLPAFTGKKDMNLNLSPISVVIIILTPDIRSDFSFSSCVP